MGNEMFVKPKELELVKESGSVLLVFNEPDRPDQANMTVVEALNLWPQLMATLPFSRLGSVFVRPRLPLNPFDLVSLEDI
jgi:hypothetical protein